VEQVKGSRKPEVALKEKGLTKVISLQKEQPKIKDNLGARFLYRWETKRKFLVC